MLTYDCLFIRESKKHGRDEWKAYDSMFHANAAVTPSVNRIKLDPSLHAATLVTNHSGYGSFCPNCFEPDHNPAECALSPIKPSSTKEQPPATGALQSRDPDLKRPPKRKEPCNRFTLYTALFKGTPGHICHSWNNGRCIFIYQVFA